VSDSVTWLGHATVVVDLDGTRLVTDPVLSRRVFHLRRDAPAPRPGSVDGVLVSHLHYDHLDVRSLLGLGRGLPVVVPRGGARALRGFGRAIEVEPGETVEVGTLRVEAVEAEHDGGAGPLRPRVRAVGYVVRGSRSIYFAGDTDLFDGMAALAPLDVALLPVGGWGPRLPPGHLDPGNAARALALLRPSIAVPIHWGTYRVAWARPAGGAPAEEFALAAAAAAPEVDVRVLPVGGTLELG
jgi:L-ascorbate metabolism protein UlaG (beta-lactamase superfamily)